MSFQLLRQAWKSDAARQDDLIGALHFGFVTSADPTTNRVRVTLQPSNVLTGWLPIVSPWVGSGWGLAVTPSPNHMVVVYGQEADMDHGVVLGMVYSQVNSPPTNAADEFVLQHSTGSRISLNKDGTITITGHGTVNISGPSIKIGGVGATLLSLCNNLFRILFNSHTHGGGPVPDQQAGATTVTTNLTAS